MRPESRLWKTCPKCQKRMKDEHLANVDELQSYLIHRIEKFLNNHGRRLGWDEILQGGIAPNANRYVVAWRRGWYCCRHLRPSCHHDAGCLLLSGQLSGCPVLPAGSYRWLPAIEESICHDPVPASLTAEEAKLVYGVQGNLWVEYIPTPEHVEYMIYPRILALAETAWSAGT